MLFINCNIPSIISYNIETMKKETHDLIVPFNSKIPFDHTLLISPNMDIFISGGVDL